MHSTSAHQLQMYPNSSNSNSLLQTCLSSSNISNFHPTSSFYCHFHNQLAPVITFTDHRRYSIAMPVHTGNSKMALASITSGHSRG
jgi:hypothetical protein